MGDVTEFIIDGASGLAPGGVDGQCMVAGCCSRGTPGKGYLVGKRSDLESILGVGPLVDALRDVLAAGGQNPVVVAVPVEGSSGGYITDVVYSGRGPNATSSGQAIEAAEVVLEVTVGGANGDAAVKISKDGGKTFTENQAVPGTGEVVIEETGARITFAATEEYPLILGDQYSLSVVTALSQHTQNGGGPAITAVGEPKAGGQLRLVILKSGELNTGTCQLSIDGGDNYGPARTLPLDQVIEVPQLGITLNLAPGEYQTGTIYSWEVLAPVATTYSVMEAITKALETYDLEFVYIVGPSDSVDWAAAAALGEELWNRHRPTYFKFETRLPRRGEDLNDWAACLIKERQNFASKYVEAIAAFGEIADSTGLSKVRSWGGLQAGRTIFNPVQRAAGRVKDGPISQARLPEGWNETIQSIVENAGYVTPKRYAGLAGVYWGDSRTMAEPTSDYIYEEPLRTVFKAMRLVRIAALKSLYSEAGDLLLQSNAAGLKMLEADIGAALDSMTRAIPQELADYRIVIPPNQDIVNNGLAVEITFIGIPIIRSLKVFGRYVYAGGKFDPRAEDVSYALSA